MPDFILIALTAEALTKFQALNLAAGGGIALAGGGFERPLIVNNARETMIPLNFMGNAFLTKMGSLQPNASRPNSPETS